jgi:HD-like signal output (HDOD) protein
MTKFDRASITASIALPALPDIVHRIGALIECPESGTAEVASLIAKDPVLTCKVMQAANSAVYGRFERCTSPNQACMVVGLRVIRNLVVEVALQKKYEHLVARGYQVVPCWKHASIVGLGASMIALSMKALTAPRPDDAYLGGLLHDIGQIILLDNLGDDYISLHAHACRVRQPIQEAEIEQLSCSHADVGAHAVMVWGLGESVAESVQHHHFVRMVEAHPTELTVYLASQIFELLADGRLAAALDFGTPEVPEALGIPRARMKEIVKLMNAQLHILPAMSGEYLALSPSRSRGRFRRR